MKEDPVYDVVYSMEFFELAVLMATIGTPTITKRLS